MALGPKDQKVVDQLDLLDLSLNTAAKQIGDALTISKTIRGILVGTTTPPVNPPPVVTPPVNPPPVVTPPVNPPPVGEVYAKPPVIFIDTKRPTVTGKRIDVPIGGDFQKAINAAQPGDEVVLAMGSKFTGNYTLPQKTGSNGFVTIRPDILTQKEGVRRAPTAGAPVFQSPNNLGALTTDAGAARYRIIGIEGTMPPTITNTGLVRLGVSETSIADLPREIVLEQVYIHGDPLGNFRRGVLFNGADLSVIDSYISECHEHGSDSQAIAGWNGTGPFKVTNSFLQAASENIIFGGADPSIAGLIPSDIEIRRCHLTKDLKWAGQNWNVKNLWEMKNAQRVLMEACVLENIWADGQVGYSTNLKSVNQGGTAPWCTTRDIMMRYCIIRNVGAGFNLIGVDPGATIPSERITIMHCLVDGFFPENNPVYMGDGRGVQVLNNPVDVELIHLTILSPWNSSLTFGGPAATPPVRFVYRDCISGNGMYGVKGPGLNTKDTFAAFMKDGKYAGNVLIGPDGGNSYPAGTSFAPTEADVGFVSKTDRRLAATSKYKGKATDGTDPGADIDTLMKMTAGVILP